MFQISKHHHKQFKESKEYEIWDQKKDIWQVTFLSDERNYFVDFNKEGKWLRTNQSLYYSEIPTSIMDSLNMRFESFTLNEIYSCFTPKGNYYKISLSKDDKEINIIMNKDGALDINL